MLPTSRYFAKCFSTLSHLILTTLWEDTKQNKAGHLMPYEGRERTESIKWLLQGQEAEQNSRSSGTAEGSWQEWFLESGFAVLSYLRCVCLFRRNKTKWMSSTAAHRVCVCFALSLVRPGRSSTLVERTACSFFDMVLLMLLFISWYKNTNTENGEKTLNPSACWFLILSLVVP